MEREERAETHMVDSELIYRHGRARSLERARRRVGTAPATVAALGRVVVHERRLLLRTMANGDGRGARLVGAGTRAAGM